MLFAIESPALAPSDAEHNRMRSAGLLEVESHMQPCDDVITMR